MNKTSIDWCSHTWNPAVGCLRGSRFEKIIVGAMTGPNPKRPRKSWMQSIKNYVGTPREDPRVIFKANYMYAGGPL